MAKREPSQASKKKRSSSKKETTSRSHKKGSEKWSHKVKTDSTHPSEGLFKKDANIIAREMATKRVSPKGIGSGIKMIQFFINRAGKTLSASRRQELEKAKRILQEKRKKAS